MLIFTEDILNKNLHFFNNVAKLTHPVAIYKIFGPRTCQSNDTCMALMKMGLF